MNLLFQAMIEVVKLTLCLAVVMAVIGFVRGMFS